MVLGLWFESARAMFFLFILLNALPVPMLRQVSLLGRKQSSHAGETHFFRKVQVLRFSKSTFYLHGSSLFVFPHVFFVFFVFCVLGGTSKIAVLLAWELNFLKLDKPFYVFLIFLAMLKKHVFTCLSFSCFFTILVFFWRPLGFFWRPFGAFVVSLAFWCHPFGCLWLAWALCGPSLLLFVVSLARLGCLWARGPLRDCFLLHFRFILVSFFEQFGGGVLSCFDF